MEYPVFTTGERGMKRVGKAVMLKCMADDQPYYTFLERNK